MSVMKPLTGMADGLHCGVGKVEFPSLSSLPVVKLWKCRSAVAKGFKNRNRLHVVMPLW